MDELTNEVEVIQENTSVDPLLRKWMKDNTCIAMEQEGSKDAKSVPNTEELKGEVLTDTNVCDDESNNKGQTHIDISLKDLWTHCSYYYERFKQIAGPGTKAFKEKCPQPEAREEFETWLDIFLCRALTTKSEDHNWFILIKEVSNSEVSLADVIRKDLVEYLTVALRNLCLHFEAYKDLAQLRDYIFGKGFRILSLLSKIESSMGNEIDQENENNSLAGSKCAKPSRTVEEKSPYNKEFVDLLIHLFQVKVNLLFILPQINLYLYTPSF